MSKKEYYVFIFDGHGTGTPKDMGAISGNFVEHKIVRKMCRATYDYLLDIPKSDRNFYISYPERDEQYTIEQQIKLMNKYISKGYKVIGIEEHMNSAGGTAGDGAEVWRNSNCSLSLKLSKEILKQFKNIGQNSRGVKSGDLMFTNAFRGNNKVASLITEFGFINNPKDRKIFDTDAEIKSAGVAIGKAIYKILG